jgi:hypothetical protein
MPDAVIPAWGQYLGACALFVLVGWLIYRDWNRDRTAARAVDGGVEAQTDAHSIEFMKVVLSEQGNLRERVALLEDRERRHAEVLQRHSSWDARAVAMLQSQDASMLAALGEPPPLYPQGS